MRESHVSGRGELSKVDMCVSLQDSLVKNRSGKARYYTAFRYYLSIYTGNGSVDNFTRMVLLRSISRALSPSRGDYEQPVDALPSALPA